MIWKLSPSSNSSLTISSKAVLEGFEGYTGGLATVSVLLQSILLESPSPTPGRGRGSGSAVSKSFDVSICSSGCRIDGRSAILRDISATRVRSRSLISIRKGTLERTSPYAHAMACL